MSVMVLSRRNLLTGAAGLFAAGKVFGAGKGLRAGCQANGWNLDPDNFELLLTAVREMKELGFEGFETNIRFFQPQIGKEAETRAKLAAIGLEFVAAHTNLPNYQRLGMEQTGDAVTKLAQEAKSFGAHALVLSHGGLSKTGEFAEQALEQKAQALNVAGRRCADAGLTLAYHNHQPEFQNHAAEELGLLKNTDAKLVYCMMDIGHAWLADPDAISVFAANPGRVFGLHVRDFHNRESVPLGQGEFPLQELAAVIRRTGWSGWLIDEEERPNLKDKPGKAATGPSRATMRAVFGV
jgi:sugar phosphate isomerase/epimerase